MKLALFTPAETWSSISRDTLWLEAELLNRGHEITIVRTESAPHIDRAPLPYESEIIRWNDSAIIERVVADVDAVVYQIGNNFPLHYGSLELMPKYPGVAIVHDYCVADMFLAWAAERREQAEAVLHAWYDSETADRFFRRASSEEFLDFAANNAPMTEWIASMATGVITHSNWAIERVLRACPGPVEVVPVPARPQDRQVLEQTRSSGQQAEASDARRHEDDKLFKVVTIGHQNRNKRQVSVIHALAASGTLRDRATYRLVGDIEPRYAQQISALAERLGLRVSIAGSVDDDTMAQAIGEADVICCLRYPTLESASGSAIEAMIAGKAIVVSDAGFYRELPDACARKISPEREVEELQLALESLYAHPEERAALGAHAAEWAKATFSLSNYVDHLTEICARVARTIPAIQASHYFADTLARWGATPGSLKASGALTYLQGLVPVSE